MIKKLLKCVREYKIPTIITFILIIFETIIEILIPFITANLVNEINGDINISGVVKKGLFLTLLAVLSLICGSFAGFTSSKASAGFAKNVRSDVFAKIQKFSFYNIDKFSSSSLVTRLTTDISNIQISYMMIIRIAIRSPLMIIFAVVMSYIMGGKLAALFAIIIPVFLIGLIIIGKKAMPEFRKIFKKYDVLNKSIEENIRGMRVVKGFSREEYEKKKFNKAANDICKDFTKVERIIAFGMPLMDFCTYFNMVFVLLVGSSVVISGKGLKINVGQLSAMLTYGMQILISLMMLMMVYVTITMSIEAAKRINEVLSEEVVLKNPENPVMTVSDGTIDFENVNFKYSSKAKKSALSGINLHIKSGMTVGIIGGTGSGKSSLVQLIPRLYDVTEGCVKIGGTDVRKYDLKVLRESVAMVLQKNVLFSGTIKENLRWGNEDATDEEIVKVCKLALADDFVSSFSDGYETKIEQGGSNVSGGQKQRLCIARALLKKPKVLILDDSTSAVDTKTDSLIRSNFKEYIPEITKIIIVQRIASVQDADMIIVMDNGTVSDIGDHKYLLENSEIYREVYEQQVNGGDDSEHE